MTCRLINVLVHTVFGSCVPAKTIRLHSLLFTLTIGDMAIPFGFSVGDFVTLGKLIGQVVVELGEVRS